MAPIISIRNLTKTYASATKALSDVSLDIREGEILALLGPNGAGKTTLISTVCGLVEPTSGSVEIGGHDIRRDYRRARSLVGLVPQEMSIEIFEKVIDTVRFTRGLFGRPRDDAYIESLLRSLSLWDKRDAKTMELSGGMKRRLLIAKALSHRPKVLFLDEPSAGVDVELRRGMWDLVRELREAGTTVILTTHYIAEAEEMADRVAVISKGRILLVEDKTRLMQSFGRKRLTIELVEPVAELPYGIDGLSVSDDRLVLSYDYDTRGERSGVARLMAALAAHGIAVRDLSTAQSSLEEVFLTLVKEDGP